MYLLPTCMSSLEECLLRSSVHFQLSSLFLILSCIHGLYTSDIDPLLIISFANIFSSMGYLFVLAVISFALQKP